MFIISGGKERFSLKLSAVSFLQQSEKFLKPVQRQPALERKDGVRRPYVLGTGINAAENGAAVPHPGAPVNLRQKFQPPGHLHTMIQENLRLKTRSCQGFQISRRGAF